MNPAPAATPSLRADRAWLAGLVIFLLGLYALSAPRTVALDDDGEFIMAGWFLGVAHPPGYPLHTLMAFAFSHGLPFGSVAWRVHLLSGVLGALAAGVLYLCARHLGVRPLLAALASLAFGLSKTWWSQAIVAEVYTLHGLLFALAWLLALRIHDGSARPALFTGLAAATGLALANHWPLMVLAGPALLPLVWPQWGALLKPRVLAVGAAAAVGPYLWLWWRSQQDPALSYYGPLRSLGDLWFFVTREGYAAVDHNPLATAWDRLQFARFALLEWLRQLTPAGVALAMLGLRWLWSQGRRAAVVSAAWSMLALGALLVARLDFEYYAHSAGGFRVYPLTAYLATALLLGCGLEALSRWAATRSRLRQAGSWVGAGLVAAVAAGSAPANWRAADDWARAYGLAILAEAPPDAVLIPDSDWAANTLGYLHLVEGHCPGCSLVNAAGLEFSPRLFEPLRTPRAEHQAALANYLDRTGRPAAWPDGAPPAVAVADRWLVRVASRTGSASVEISPQAAAFFRERVIQDHPDDATVRTVQQDLRRRYLFLLAVTAQVEPAQAAALCVEFYACLGLAEGMLRRADHYGLPLLERVVAGAAAAMPGGVHRWDRARVIELRGLALARLGRASEAVAALQEAVKLAPDATAEGRAALAELGVETQLVPER